MELDDIKNTEMPETSNLQWNVQWFDKRKLVMTTASIIMLLLLIVSLLAVVLILTRDIHGVVDDIQKAEGILQNTAAPTPPTDPEPTPKTGLKATSKGDFKSLDCYDILRKGSNRNGVYDIYPFGIQKAVYCDQETDGGGWTVFQRRCDGSEDFFRGWYDYQSGFGNLSNEFWLGNQFMGMLTKQRNYTLRIDLEDFETEKLYAEYYYFTIGEESTAYQLTIRGYSGTAGDSLTRQSGQPFATKDNDREEVNCPNIFSGAWWYEACHDSNLNGLYHAGFHRSNADGVNWKTWRGFNYSLKSTEMKCRPTVL